MHIQLKPEQLSKLETGVLIIPVFSDTKKLPESLNFLRKHLNSPVDKLLTDSHLDWKLNQKMVLYTQYSHIPVVVLMGAGKQAEWDYENARQFWGQVIQAAHELKEKRLAIYWDGQFPSGADAETHFIEAISALTTAAYRVTHFLTDREDLPPEIENIDVVYPDGPDHLTDWITKGEQLGKSVNLARQLAEFPSNELTPEIFSGRVQELGKTHSWQLEILDQKALEKKNLKALLAVAQGSENLPYLAIASYRHPAAKKTVGLVGKGVTFDSGGISIKPAKNMEEMKYDMSGAAAVLGALSAITQTGLPVNVTAAMPLVENMLSGKAVRPGDIVTSYSGKTIEIINTDAEGRLILADTLSYLERNYQPDYLVDLATLTGSVVAALGNVAAGIFSTEEELMNNLKDAGEIAGERLWPLPLWEEYQKMIKSKIADMRNISNKPGAGAITAGIFLQYFVEKTPWAHIDIAGTAYDMPEKSYRPEGATGFGVKLLWHWLNRFSH